MATIPNPGSELRHVRKTITFTGGANAGQLGSAITVFTGTGSNYIVALFGRLTVNISCVNPSNTKLYLGPAAFTPASTNGDVLNINGATAAGQWVATPWWGFDTGYETNEFHHACVGDIMLYPFDDGSATGTNITGGTIIVDCWYRPITDDGALAGDDIDSALVDAVWDEPQSGHVTAGTFGRYLDSQLATIAGYIDTEIGAIKAVTDNLPNSGALSAIQSDLDDLQTRLPAALVGGRMDSSVGAMAAAVITAAAIATDAIDADALAADAVTEIWAKAMSELASVPAVNGTVLQALEWIFLLARNKITQTATTQTLRNDADNANLSTSTVSDDGTTFTRGEWS